jgi:hypothetical protein
MKITTKQRWSWFGHKDGIDVFHGKTKKAEIISGTHGSFYLRNVHVSIKPKLQKRHPNGFGWKITSGTQSGLLRKVKAAIR